MARQGDIRIGTSGWSYDHWVGPFYPEDLPRDRRLRYYAERFRSVEIDSSFYGLPRRSTLRAWRDEVPADFVFAAKASRYITHMKKLRDPRQGLDRFLKRMGALGDRLGPVVFQLPPRWRFDAGRLEAFLQALGRGFRCAFELRDPSWLNAEALALLERHRAAFCIYDLGGFLSPKEVTADFVYVRLHGPGGPYQGSYGDAALSGWARAISGWSRKGLSVYCYFDNDDRGYAASNAARLQEMLGRGRRE
jgi:uncharacterized protein YecE (DUF72 family)